MFLLSLPGNGDQEGNNKPAQKGGESVQARQKGLSINSVP